MRRSCLSLAIGVCLAPGIQIAKSRHGPISPYQSFLNQEIYYRMIGQPIVRGRAMGKTRSFEKNLMWAWRYQGNSNDLQS